MEITLHWFWLTSLAYTFVLFALTYIAIYKHKFTNKWFNIALAIIILLGILNPIKLKPETASNIQTRNIEATKQLPDKTIDDKFEQKASAIKGITKEELQ